MTSMRFLALMGMGAALTLVGAAGCGARTDALADVGSAGTTGTGGGGAGGSGGNGGNGGNGGSGGSVTPECGPLTPVGEAVVVEAAPNMNSLLPQLAHSGGLNKQAREVLGIFEIPVEGPMGIQAELHTLGLEPWGAWPPLLSPSAMLSNAEGQIAIAEGIATDLAALYMTPAGDVLYSPELLAGAPGPASGLDLATKAAPCFLAKQQTGHVFGLGLPYTFPSGEGATEIAVGFATPGPSGPALSWMVPLGCSQGGAIADGEAVEGGVLVAFGSGQAPLDLAGCAGGLDPTQFPFPSRLVVAKITGNPTTATLGTFDDTFSQIDRIAMAGRSDGAWVVWSRFALQGNPGNIRAARLDADGNFAAGPWALADGFDLHTASIGADRLGDDLVVAWADVSQTPTRIEVRRIDGAGAEVAKESFEVKGSLMQAIAVIGSPAGDGVLLAYSLWSESEGRAKVHLRRLGCKGQAP